MLTSRSFSCFCTAAPASSRRSTRKCRPRPRFAAPSAKRPRRLPGVTFGASFPKLAALADKLAVVRSYVPGDADHDIKPVVCRETFGANLGSIYARMAGTNNPANGLPTNVVLFPRSVDPSTQAGTMNFGKFGAVGPFGSACAPFDPSGGGDLRQDMRLTLPLSQLEDRRRLLSQLDQAKRGLADAAALDDMDHTRAQAFDAVLGGAADAFDLSKETGVGRGPLRHRPAGAAGEHRQEVEKLQ